MSDFPIPSNESERIKLIHDVMPLLQANAESLKQVVIIAAHFMNCPMAGLSLVDSEVCHLVAKTGLDSTPEFSRDEAFDSYTILSTTDPLVIIPDAALDYRFSDSFLLNGPLKMHFYAAVPIIYQEVKIGTLFIADQQSHIKKPYDEEQLSIFKQLGQLVSDALSAGDSFSQKLQFTDDFAEGMIISLLKAVKQHYQTLYTNQDEFYTTMKVLNKYSKNQSDETKLTLLQSIDSLQTVIFQSTDAVQQFLQHGIAITTALKVLMAQTIANRAYSGQIDRYVTLNDWIRRLKKYINLSRHQEGNIKWEYDNFETLKCYDHLQELLGFLVTVLMIVQLPKWKNITMSTSFTDEQGNNAAAIRRKSDEVSANGDLKKVNLKPGKIVIEMACFHRNTPAQKSSPNLAKSENESSSHTNRSTPTLLEEFTVQLMALLQGQYEKTTTNSSEIIKISVATSLYPKPQKVRQSMFRNSILAIEGTLRNSILMVAYRDNRNTSNLAKSGKEIGSKKEVSITETTTGSATSTTTANNEAGISKSTNLLVTARSSQAGSNNSLPVMQHEVEAVKSLAHDSNLNMLKPKAGRRRSSIAKTNKVKSQIVTSIMDSIAAVIGSGPVNLKKSTIVPTSNE